MVSFPVTISKAVDEQACPEYKQRTSHLRKVRPRKNACRIRGGTHKCPSLRPPTTLYQAANMQANPAM